MRFNKGAGGGSYENPTAEIHLARLSAIYDCGVRQAPGSKFGPKHTMVLVWTLGVNDSEGKPFLMFDPCTMSLIDGAHLAARVEAILKRGLTEAEREDFDPRSILGAYAKLWLKETPNGKVVVKQAQPVEEGHAIVKPGEDFGAEVPRYVAKVVDEEANVLTRFLTDIKAGEAAGPDAIAMALPFEGTGVVPGREPAQPGATPPTAAPTLPEGWTAHVDANSGRTYYASPDGVTQWEAPTPPAPTAPTAPTPPPAGTGKAPF